uniref:steroid 21-hydroxylase n=1 Tax=Myxine glutinosa TaxID=7769 RepID=UPI00358FF790
MLLLVGTDLLLFAVFLIALLLLLWSRNKRVATRGVDRLPPGPTGLPLLGNVLELTSSAPHLKLAQLCQRYGPVCRLTLGSQLLVVLGSAKVIREALQKKAADFAGRPQTFTVDMMSFGGKDLALGDSTSLWHQQRRATIAAMQAVGNERTEATVLAEAESLCALFHSYEGQPVDPRNDLSIHACNIICSLAFGTRYKKDDPEFQEIHECLDLLVQIWGSPAITILDHFPFLRKFPNPPWRRFLAAMAKRDEIVRRHIKAHKLKKERETDITAALLCKLEEQKETEDGGDKMMEEHIHMAIVDLFIGGSETTATVLAWTIAFLVHFPEVQERIHNEVMAALAHGQPPSYADRHSMPFLSATLKEVLRLRPVAPLAIPHRTTCDTSVGGYSIPKGTTVIPNLWGAHHDENTWPNPTHFKPERYMCRKSGEQPFLNSLPFSAGPRLCLGMALAQLELFLFSVCLLRDFRFTSAVPGHLPDLDGTLGAVLKPRPFQVRVLLRSETAQRSGSK